MSNNKKGNRSCGRFIIPALVAVLFTSAFVAFAGEKSHGCGPAAADARQKSGMKTVVIDPGHGGIEPGAKGGSGAMEKDVTLAISLKLKALLEKSMSCEVIMTRDRDMDVPLETRAALANNHRADLFLSIHVNGSKRESASGSETFFMSLNATDEETRRLAYLENKSSGIENRMATSSGDELKMILWDMAQTAFIRQSSQLAELIQSELNTLLGTKDRGVKQAPFKVLCGVAAPAVLVEVAFMSNPEEEQKLIDEGFQTSVAQAIYRGLVGYMRAVGSKPPAPAS
jgi:N-acetylmuramoyl-L-alanine amidase